MTQKIEPTWTVETLLYWARDDFASRKFPDARLAAEVLLSHSLKMDRVGLYLHFDRPVLDEERAHFRELVIKRRQGCPVAYLTREKEFYSLPFYVDSRVLIPRPETEILVDEVLQYLERMKCSSPRICDVGCGSGAISIAIKKNIPLARVTGIDNSSEALEVARTNAERHETDLSIIHGDLLANLSEKFDVIVANPPYVSRIELETLSADVREHEPHSALLGGEDGLEVIRRLVKQAKGHLDGGALFLEIGMGQKEPVCTLLRDEGFQIHSVRNDLSNIPRVVIAEARVEWH